MPQAAASPSNPGSLLGPRTLLVLGVLVAVAGSPPGLRAQDADTVPAPADTLPADTASVAADTIPGAVGAPVDSVGPVPADTLPADTLPADTLGLPTVADSAVAEAPPLEHLPTLEPPVPSGWETAVWSWNREELLGVRATTLAELLEEVPGLIPLRGGDFGMPRSVSAMGSAGGGVRVFRDGVEFLPMEGSVPDLSRLGLGRAESVRVVRTGSGVEVHIRSLEAGDPRPYSRIEAGTGDLDTNVLEGVFFHPRALGGNVAFSLQRIDTRGPRGAEPGAVRNVGLRYAWLSGDRLGVVAEVTRSSTDRDTLYLPPEVQRTDVTLQTRWRPLDGLTAELFWSRASLDADSVGGVARSFPFENRSRRQWGGRLAGELGPVSARAAYRSYDGPGLPDSEVSGELSAVVPELGGLAAGGSRTDWEGGDVVSEEVRAWTAPFRGLSAFASWTDFQGGVPGLPAGGEPDPTPDPAMPDSPAGFYEGRSIRLGGRFQWRGLEISGARLDLERDSVHPLGLPVDRGGPVSAAGSRTGWEAAVRLPVPLLDGLAVRGSGQLWDREAPGWSYFPRRSWRGGLSFHDTFLPTGNLEVWADVGVEGRDPMWVSRTGTVEVGEGGTPDGGTVQQAWVPAYRSWYSRLQIRVVTVRIFVRWENMTLRDDLQDFPGRILPRTRAMYGIRWTLWD